MGIAVTTVRGNSSASGAGEAWWCQWRTLVGWRSLTAWPGVVVAVVAFGAAFEKRFGSISETIQRHLGQRLKDIWGSSSDSNRDAKAVEK